MKSQELPISEISNELKAEHENVRAFTLMRNPIFNADSNRLDTVTFAYVQFRKKAANRRKGAPSKMVESPNKSRFSEVGFGS